MENLLKVRLAGSVIRTHDRLGMDPQWHFDHLRHGLISYVIGRRVLMKLGTTWYHYKILPLPMSPCRS